MKRHRFRLGAGNVPSQQGWIDVDIVKHPNVTVIHDLNTVPWPWHSGEAVEISAIHLLEHLDNFFAFFDECHRLLLPGGTLYIETPDAADLDLSFADPTHKLHLRKHSFINYLGFEGIRRWQLTKRAWSMLHIVTDGHVIRGHFMPVPLEAYPDDILKAIGGSWE